MGIPWGAEVGPTGRLVPRWSTACSCGGDALRAACWLAVVTERDEAAAGLPNGKPSGRAVRHGVSTDHCSYKSLRYRLALIRPRSPHSCWRCPSRRCRWLNQWRGKRKLTGAWGRFQTPLPLQSAERRGVKCESKWGREWEALVYRQMG
jgi:hypothetical protein